MIASELGISQRVKVSTLEEINLGFNTWLSLIAVIPKKNGQIRVCVDYRKLCWHKRSLLPTFYPECEHTLKLGLKYIS